MRPSVSSGIRQTSLSFSNLVGHEACAGLGYGELVLWWRLRRNAGIDLAQGTDVGCLEWAYHLVLLVRADVNTQEFGAFMSLSRYPTSTSGVWSGTVVDSMYGDLRRGVSSRDSPPLALFSGASASQLRSTYGIGR